MQMVRAQAAFRNTAGVVAASGNESERRSSPPFTIAASLPAAPEGVVSVAALGQGTGGKLEIAECGRSRSVAVGVLRQSGAVRPAANLVVANLLMHARTDVLGANVTPSDRGTGIVTAP